MNINITSELDSLSKKMSIANKNMSFEDLKK